MCFDSCTRINRYTYVHIYIYILKTIQDDVSMIFIKHMSIHTLILPLIQINLSHIWIHLETISWLGNSGEGGRA